MPGKIVKILVAEGDEIKARGQPLVIVESMKMENEIKSPTDRHRQIDCISAPATWSGTGRADHAVRAGFLSPGIPPGCFVQPWIIAFRCHI